MFLFSVVVAVRGVDFGHHWDERKILDSVSHSIENATLLPDWYNYPSVSYGLAMAGIAPEAASALEEARAIVAEDADKTERKNRLAGVASDLAGVVSTHAYLLRIRTIFLLVSLLSVVWVYTFVYMWRRSWWEGFVAAVFLGTSWEVGYHARWIAPDAVLMQFAALLALTLLPALRGCAKSRFWLYVSAVVAGLACGTKYNGGLLLVPVLVVAAMSSRENGLSPKRVVASFVAPALLFAAAFLLSTPGAFVQPFRFAYDVVGEMRHYQTGHGEHTIAPGFVHAYRMWEYLSLVAFSRYWPGALLVFAFAIAGGYSLLRHDRRMGVILLLVPALYAAFMSMQRAMIVRNLLVLMPFLAILAAHGTAMAAGAIRGRAVRIAVGVAVAVLMTANTTWLVLAAESIVHKKTIDHGWEITRYLADHSEQKFFLSSGAYDALRSAGGDHANVTLDRGEADRIMVMTTDLGKWFGNRRGVMDIVSGSFEVNLEYYPSWRNDAMVIAVDPESANRMWFEAPTLPDHPTR